LAGIVRSSRAAWGAEVSYGNHKEKTKTRHSISVIETVTGDE
jgi:hypothetical protein